MCFGSYIRELREGRAMRLRDLAEAVSIDVALLSKIERGKRKARKEQVLALAEALQTDHEVLRKKWLAGQVYELVKEEEDPAEILRAAEEEAEYHKKSQSPSQEDPTN